MAICPIICLFYELARSLMDDVIRFQHHLKNYEFYATNNFVPQGLLPRCMPAFE